MKKLNQCILVCLLLSCNLLQAQIDVSFTSDFKGDFDLKEICHVSVENKDRMPKQVNYFVFSVFDEQNNLLYQMHTEKRYIALGTFPFEYNDFAILNVIKKPISFKEYSGKIKVHVDLFNNVINASKSLELLLDKGQVVDVKRDISQKSTLDAGYYKNIETLKSNEYELDLLISNYVIPVAKLGHQFSGSMPTGQLKTFRAISVEVKHVYALKFNAIGFECIHVQKNGAITKSRNVGKFFTEETKSLIHKAMPGDIIIFDNIKVQRAGCMAQQANSIVLRVK